MFFLPALLSIVLLFQYVIFMCGKQQTKKPAPDKEKNKKMEGKKPDNVSDPDGKKKVKDQENVTNQAIAPAVPAKPDDNEAIKEKSNLGQLQEQGNDVPKEDNAGDEPKTTKPESPENLKAEPPKNKKPTKKELEEQKKEKKKDEMVKHAIKKGLMAPQDDNNTIEEFKSSWGVPQDEHVSTILVPVQDVQPTETPSQNISGGPTGGPAQAPPPNASPFVPQ